MLRPWVTASVPLLPQGAIPSILVDRALIAPLAGSRNQSGYRCVYPHKWGFRAVVKWGGNEANGGRLRHWPTTHLASQAAEMVARWLKLRLGPRWAELIRAHKRNLWRMHAPFTAWHSRRKRGWHVAVWVEGQREGVCDEGWKLRTFPTWSAAADFVPEYMQAAHGADWWHLFWR